MTKPVDPRVTRFDDAVQQKMDEGGLSQRDAASAVVRQSPDLHCDYLAAANPGMDIPRRAATPVDPRITRFNDAVQAKVAAGLSLRDAISAVVTEQPILHSEYLEAVNRAIV